MPHLRTSLFHLTLGATLTLLAMGAKAQITVSGQVMGKDSIALMGASVVNSSNKAIAITDEGGLFTIMARMGDPLDFSFVGYATQRIVVNSSNLTIHLQEISNLLPDVVVMGYGAIPRKDAIGAVSKITTIDFNPGLITHPLQQIQGKLAGVSITQPGGDPNGDFTVRIRGASSIEGQPPLLVIDGVAIDNFNRAITTVNPSDIESYDVLKDASAAAIYGARGANGVILITTKKGNPGKSIVEYNGFTGIDIVANQIKVLSADEWRYATAVTGDGAHDKGANTNWQKEIERIGLTQNHQIGISGGSNQLTFRGSLGYTKQEGIILNSGKEMISARLSAQQVNSDKRLLINYALNGSVINRSLLPDQSSTSQAQGGGSNLFSLALTALPVVPVRNADGTYYNEQGPTLSANPSQILNDIYSKKRESFFQGSVKTDYEIINGLKAGLFGALSMGHDIYDYADPRIAQPFSNLATKADANKEILSADAHINYIKDWGQHHLQFTGVYEYNRFINDGFSLTAHGFQFPDFLNNNFSAATQISTTDISSYKNEVRLVSALGRAMYHYRDRYFVTINFRRDGSSKFGPNHQWATFPSVALAWRLSEEGFIKTFSWINNLRLRGSYGLTGNQENLPADAYQLVYGVGGPFLYKHQFFQGYGSIREYNPDLQWEVRRSLNVGLDFSLYNNRIYGTLDVYDDYTSDMLFNYSLPQPPFLNGSVLANAANATNQGIEISMGAVIRKTARFQWNTQLNISRARNSITNLAGQFVGVSLDITNRHYGYALGGGLSDAYVSQIQKGFPAGVFWLPVHAGFDTDGKELFNTYDKDGNLTGTKTSYTDQDRRYIDPTPDFSYGLTNNFSFGRFDASLFIRGVQGQKIFANTLLNLQSPVYLPRNNVSPEALTNGFTGQPQPSDLWVKDGSYARLQNATVGYTLNNLRGLSKLRIYGTATNLFVLTSYGGVDPEVNVEGSQRYIDSSYYPKSRGFLIGVQATF
ncbi:MAG TPA: SusC/RagA family TonB-linked outer membrane protein [Cyclobacteriaceae bacterium]|nr:SusC/RagA family TonB-linked outer membrane protein [Cyclobacteriaceae bacterium]